VERKKIQPLSPEDAKARLRAVSTGGQVLSWVSSYPKEATLAAFIVGVIVGTSPTARDALVRGVIALLRGARP
jgi:hypothetical protein